MKTLAVICATSLIGLSQMTMALAQKPGSALMGTGLEKSDNKKNKKSQYFAYPTSTFQATNSRTTRNVPRYDLSKCGHYSGGPKGSIIPAGKKTVSGVPAGTHGKIAGGFVGNCDRKEVFGMGSVMHQGSFVRGMIYHDDVGSYDDGDGNKVRFGGKTTKNTATIGYASKKQKFTLTGGVVRKRDILFGGASADTPELDVNFARFNYKIDNNFNPINKIRVGFGLNQIDRINENFSIRTFSGAKPKVRVKLDITKLKGQVLFGFRAMKMQYMLGGGFKTENRDGTRYRDHSTLGSLTKQNLNYADTSIDKFSVIYKGTAPSGPISKFKLWAQFDHIQADAGKANEIQVGRPGSAPKTANELWLATYGVTGDDTKHENSFSGSLRYERNFAPGSQWFIEGGRYMRTADMHERFNSSWVGPSKAKNWAGNPEIDPEAHHKLSLGVKVKKGPVGFGVSGYADIANDYIIRDNARGQDGILLTDGSNVYRNVDARIFAIASSFDWRFAPGWKLGLWGQYAYGENTQDDRALAQIPALEGRLKLAYNQSNWGLGAELRGVSKQSRVDDDITVGSGHDDEETDGFVTLDLFASLNPAKSAQIKFGVENVFDTTYKEHIERMDIGDSDKTRINMPGRTFWVRSSIKF